MQWSIVLIYDIRLLSSNLYCGRKNIYFVTWLGKRQIPNMRFWKTKHKHECVKKATMALKNEPIDLKYISRDNRVMAK